MNMIFCTHTLNLKKSIEWRKNIYEFSVCGVRCVICPFFRIKVYMCFDLSGIIDKQKGHFDFINFRRFHKIFRRYIWSPENFVKPVEIGYRPLYVKIQSNHPPTVIKQIPEGINSRLSAIFSKEEHFDNAKRIYQKALNDSGNDCELKFKQPGRNRKAEQAKEKKHVLWPSIQPRNKDKHREKVLGTSYKTLPKEAHTAPALQQKHCKEII